MADGAPDSIVATGGTLVLSRPKFKFIKCCFHTTSTKMPANIQEENHKYNPVYNLGSGAWGSIRGGLGTLTNSPVLRSMMKDSLIIVAFLPSHLRLFLPPPSPTISLAELLKLCVSLILPTTALTDMG